MNRKLILNADDFGLSPGINRAVEEAFLKGTLTSASLCSAGEYFPEAAAFCRRHSRADAGLHIVLTGERPVSEPQTVASLVDDRGRFFPGVMSLAGRLFSKKIKVAELVREIEAQFEKMAEAGIGISHIDSHQYVHLLPVIADVVLDTAKRYGVRYLRCPRNRVSVRLSGVGFFRRAQYRLLRNFSRSFFQEMKRKGFADPPACFGFLSSGSLSLDHFSEYLRCLPPGVSELLCHPAYEEESMKTRYSSWGYNWEQEKNMLLSGEIPELLERYRVIPVSFARLGQENDR